MLEKLFKRIEKPLEIACVFGIAYIIGRMILYFLYSLEIREWKIEALIILIFVFCTTIIAIIILKFVEKYPDDFYGCPYEEWKELERKWIAIKKKVEKEEEEKGGGKNGNRCSENPTSTKEC